MTHGKEGDKITLDKAIELIEHCAKTHARYDRVEIKDALKLGLEALKFKQSIRAHMVDDFDALLPGETEE